MEPELKKAKTFDEQVDILEERKLLIADREETKRILARVNYYRLSGYFKYFYVEGKEEFKEGTTFDELYKLYKFDESLRRLVMNLTEEVEVSFRTYVAYYIAHNFGEEGHLDVSKFDQRSEAYHNRFIDRLNDKIDSYEDKEFIMHHKEKYEGKLPIWVTVEIFSFNDLSRLYGNMKNTDRKEVIKANYKDPKIVRSAYDVRNWIKALTDVRNMCAHYERLFNKRLVNSIKLPPMYEEKVFSNSLFAALIVLKLLVNDTEIWDEFMNDLNGLFDKYGFKDLESMGFTEDWEEILESKKD
ncbi:Abi family protein [Romboutsia sp.]|uniref:Abi family protein n=1 Tax=Romboutsia sp. TaxID=1965302 RepID=UPI003F40AE58